MSDEDFVIDPKASALVLIDLQKRPSLSFSPGGAQQPRDCRPALRLFGRRLQEARRHRRAGPSLVPRRWPGPRSTTDGRGLPSSSALGPMPEGFLDELDQQDSDLVVTKRQWGAFYGTDLELQLRRRGIDTIVLGGIATNFGVESTARDAFERDFALIFAEDAMAGASAEAHAFALSTVFPRLGRIRSTRQILEALERHGT